MRELEKLQQELLSELTENILPFWMERMPNPHNGGFYGELTADNEVVAGAPQSSVMYGRILWTFSAAYRLLGKEEYRLTAERAMDYLLHHFYDAEHGGIYWSVDSQGNPLDTKKQFYALGFAIYGLSEYNRATGDAKALEYAIELFESIEAHSFDPEFNGYLEAKTRDWHEIGDMRLSDKDENEKKTMNTHLHIIEPYTNLYRVWRNDRLKERIVNLIGIFMDQIYSPDTHHLGLFFDERWNEKSTGTYSYGHDIEASWLLLEAACETGDNTRVEAVKASCELIAQAAMEGHLPNASMAYERHSDRSVDYERHWWVQAEAVVGLFYLYRFHSDENALRQAISTWGYIKQNLVDREHGEWFWSVYADGTINRRDCKAGFWKCPYHNGRMCMEIIAMNG